MGPVRLEPISQSNVRAVFELDVCPEQRRYVASNAWSLAQALTQPDVAWPRAVIADGQVVGFLMLELDEQRRDGRAFRLWRFMIGAEHQRHGFGTVALSLVIDEVRARGATELYTSWHPGEGSPEPFYLRAGFMPTGEIRNGEIVARLPLEPTVAVAES